MKGKDDELTYYLFSSGKRYFLFDSNGNMASDACDTPDEVVQKYKNWRVPLDKISLLPPNQSLLEIIAESYPIQEIEPVMIDDDLKEYIEWLKVA